MKEIPLIEQTSDAEAREEPDDGLRDRFEKLVRDSQENHRINEQRVILAELKVEAMRAGIVDLDGLRFLDTTQIHLDETGGISGGPTLIGKLKQAKPWLFSAPSSSSVANVPPSKPARLKLARDMSDAEYRIARANIIKR